MVSDYPEAYAGQPGLEFIEKVPVVWDETKVVGGEPAKFVAVARRSGDSWYVGAMTNCDARDIEVPLSFLGAGEYEAKIFADGPEAETDGTSLSVSAIRISANKKMTLHLAPGGGAALILAPVK
jgi:alpha-glucosidase